MYDLHENLDNTYNEIKPYHIESVPKAKIFKNDTDKLVYNICRYVLTKAMHRNDGFKNDEVAVLISNDGSKHVTIMGYNGVIDTSNSDYEDLIVTAKEKSLIMIHNHPNNSRLSLYDLLEFMSASAILAIIAVGNGGGISYCIKTSSDYNYMGLSYRISRILSMNKESNFQEEVRQKLFKNQDKYKLKFGYVNHRRYLI